MIETSSLDFVYLECDPRTHEPSACIYLKAGGKRDYAGVKADRLITSECLTFIELDAEIRRLHAELDEVRGRAKKKFYKTFAAAAGD
jgi:hypothetical protein